MTRAVQIRRGDAADHDNFTGMPGELTFNTETNELYVHDGTTLGGFAMAKTDLSNVSTGALQSAVASTIQILGFDNAIDPNQTPSTVWNSLFDEYNLARKNFGISGNNNIATVAYLEYTFDSIQGADPVSAAADCVLVCQSAEAGYEFGDIVNTFGIGSRFCPKPNLFSDFNGLNARLLIGGEAFWVLHKTTAIQTAISSAKWKIRYRVWY